MKFSVTGQKKCDRLMQVTAWVVLMVLYMKKRLFFQQVKSSTNLAKKFLDYQNHNLFLVIQNVYFNIMYISYFSTVLFV
jgi:hypothetical protein